MYVKIWLLPHKFGFCLANVFFLKNVWLSLSTCYCGLTSLLNVLVCFPSFHKLHSHVIPRTGEYVLFPFDVIFLYTLTLIRGSQNSNLPLSNSSISTEYRIVTVKIQIKISLTLLISKIHSVLLPKISHGT